MPGGPHGNRGRTRDLVAICLTVCGAIGFWSLLRFTSHPALTKEGLLMDRSQTAKKKKQPKEESEFAFQALMSNTALSTFGFTLNA